jgi:CRP-like cAMP-binding protein
MELSRIHPKIVETLRTLANMTNAEVVKCMSRFELRSFKRKEHFLIAGEICRVKGYVNKGCFRRYTTSMQGKEVILNFAMEDWWIGDLESMSSLRPSIYSIQALEDSEVFCISETGHLQLCAEMPGYFSLHEEKIKRSHFASLKRLTVAQAGTPEEKYLLLVQQQPQLLQRVPMHYIASYLGIEPESLSRLRRRMAEKEKNLNHRQ